MAANVYNIFITLICCLFSDQRVELLENDIHCITVRMQEAEQIRKKYKAIQEALLNDSKYFESNLREMDKALAEQQNDIANLRVIIKAIN